MSAEPYPTLAPGALGGTNHPVDITSLGDDRQGAQFPSGDAQPEDAVEICRAPVTEFTFALD